VALIPTFSALIACVTTFQFRFSGFSLAALTYIQALTNRKKLFIDKDLEKIDALVVQVVVVG